MSRLSQLKTLISSLPPTPLRPAGSPQLTAALQSIAGRMDSRATGPNAEKGEAALKAMQASLERISSGQALQQYPLSSRTLSPAHDPQYYTRIKDGVHRAAEGKGRSWWKSFFQIKGDA